MLQGLLQTSSLQPIKIRGSTGVLLRSTAFLIYINHLHMKLNASVAGMCADDTSITFSSNSISTINNVVNEDLESLKKTSCHLMSRKHIAF